MSMFLYDEFYLTYSCKLSLTDRRNCLSTESVEAIECLRAWLGASVVKEFAVRLEAENRREMQL